MMEYFTYKKVKKHQAEKRAEAGVQTPILTREDETFLSRIAEEGTPPPLPARPSYFENGEVGNSAGNDSQMVVHDGNKASVEEKRDLKGKGKATGNDTKHKDSGKDGKDKKKTNRFSFLSRGKSKKEKLSATNPEVSTAETHKEEDDINKVLDELNLAAVNNRAFSVSKESQVLVQKFTVILKDLVNGVPTAYDDLVALLEDSQGTLAKSYDHLPSFLQKLITTLPQKLTGTLAPELLAVATEAQAFAGAGAGAAALGAAESGGLAGAAKRLLMPTSLKDLVTKPGAIASMLKAIMNALKLRWPAFMGTNVLLSLGLFVLLFVFWYCHKRGREVRLAREAGEAGLPAVDSAGRIVEVEDDPMLTAGPSGAAGAVPGQTLRPAERPMVYGSHENLNAHTSTGYAPEPSTSVQRDSVHHRHK